LAAAQLRQARYGNVNEGCGWRRNEGCAARPNRDAPNAQLAEPVRLFAIRISAQMATLDCVVYRTEEDLFRFVLFTRKKG
jgi:hypothetical protein